MTYGSYSSQRYIETSVVTASPEERIVILYEHAIRTLRLAMTQIENRDLAGKQRTLGNALRTIHHLQTSLDMRRGGDIAIELNKIYQYLSNKILEASIHLKVEPLQESVKLLSTLLDSWREIAKNNAQAANLMPTAMVG